MLVRPRARAPTCCHGHSLLLSSYLCKVKRKENSLCSACGHPLQDLTHLLDCPASEPLRRAIFGTTSSIFDSGPDLVAYPDCWVFVEFFHAPILRKGSGSTTTTKTSPYPLNKYSLHYFRSLNSELSSKVQKQTHCRRMWLDHG